MRACGRGLAILAALASPCVAQSPAEIFQQALVQERIAGRLDSAIVLYQRVVRQAGSDRALTARALLGVGRAYELLGRTGAHAAYTRLVRDYPDQREAARQARARIAALNPTPTARPASTVPEIRRVWPGPRAAGESPPWPEGGLFPFIIAGHVAIHDFATGRDRRLTVGDSLDGPGDQTHEVRLSPDGKRVAYTWYVDRTSTPIHHELRIVPIDGGRPRVVPLRGVRYLTLHSWSPDGKQLIASVSGAERGDPRMLAVIDVGDGSVRRLRNFPGAECTRAEMSADGKWIAFDVPANDSLGQPFDIRLIAADGTREHALVSHPAWDWAPFWTPDGSGLVFMSDRTGGWSSWLVDVVDGQAAGQARLVKADMGGNQPLGFAPDGSFLYSPVGLKEIQIVTLDSVTGAAVSQPHTPNQALIGNHMQPDWSPDGRSLAMISARGNGKSVPGNRVLETIDLVSGLRAEFRFPFDFFFHPRWSPDGRAILLPAENSHGPMGIFIVNATTGTFRLLFEQARPNASNAQWSANGRSVFHVHVDATRSTISRFDLADSSQHQIYATTGAEIMSIAPSKDGRYLAFSEGRRPLLKLISLDDGNIRDLPLSRSEGDTVARGYHQLNWTKDGELLAMKLRVRSGVTMELWRIPIDGRQPRKLAYETPTLLHMRLSPDGNRIAYWSAPDDRALPVWAMRNFLPPRPRR